MMSTRAIDQAQADMRHAYFSGAPGVMMSGLAWAAAGVTALLLRSEAISALVLLAGGVLIHPLSLVLCRLLGRPARHEPGNPLAVLAIEGTFFMLVAIAVAYGLHVVRPDLFFPAVLLIIGGRYLTFQTIYGVRVYWLLGIVLIAAGFTLAINRSPMQISLLAGVAIELAFAALLFAQQARRPR
jgi:hypothetical protein